MNVSTIVSTHIIKLNFGCSIEGGDRHELIDKAIFEKLECLEYQTL
ncbi:MAG: hypothetical protein WBA57_16760 [Elainellaceae cyanobacterium]